jgi:hypothetical protein
MIIAAATGVPAIAIDYHPKVRHFADSIGADDWVIEISTGTSEEIEGLALRGLSGGYPLPLVREKMDVLREHAREAGQIAAELVRSPKRANVPQVRVARSCRAILRRLHGRRKW